MKKLISALLAIVTFFQFLPFATWGCGLENAYLTVLKMVVRSEVDGSIKYFAADMDGVAQSEKIQAYCDRHGITPMGHDTPLVSVNDEGVVNIVTGAGMYTQKEIPLSALLGGVNGYRYNVKRIGWVWFIVSKEVIK